VLAESVSADCRVSQVVRQRVPHRRTSHGESPPGKCTWSRSLRQTHR